VIGVGNPYRRDDGVGPAVVRRLHLRRLPGVTLVESDGEPAALIEMWNRRRLAILVDAVRTNPSHPGRVYRFVVRRPAGGRISAASSHGLGLGDSVALAHELGRLPDRMVIFAIEVVDRGFGAGLTPTVEAAAERVANRIATEIVAAGRADEPLNPSA
jgi:hydrogenase maturation protease